MRVLCLYVPRPGIQLVQRANPELAGRPVALLEGEGDDARVVAASSPEIPPGLTAGQARRRFPGLRFLPDNAAACYEELDRLASIIHANATPLVAIGGRDHLFVDIRGLGGRFGDEPGIAKGLAGMARTWSALDVRVGIAGSRAEALAAARTARRGPLCIQGGGAAAAQEPPVIGARAETLAGGIRLAGIATGQGRRNAIVRAVRRLAILARGRGEVPRCVAVRVDAGGASTWRVIRPGAPLTSECAILDAVLALAGDALDAASAMRIELRSLVPLPAEVPGTAPVQRREAPAPAMRRGRQLMLAAG